MKIEVGQSGGIVRRVDDLGRIVLPKEFRQRLHIHTDDAIELKLCENGLYLEKLQTPNGANLLRELLDTLYDKEQASNDPEQNKKIKELKAFLLENRESFEVIE